MIEDRLKPLFNKKCTVVISTLDVINALNKTNYNSNVHEKPRSKKIRADLKQGDNNLKNQSHAATSPYFSVITKEEVILSQSKSCKRMKKSVQTSINDLEKEKSSYHAFKLNLNKNKLPSASTTLKHRTRKLFNLDDLSYLDDNNNTETFHKLYENEEHCLGEKEQINAENADQSKGTEEKAISLEDNSMEGKGDAFDRILTKEEKLEREKWKLTKTTEMSSNTMNTFIPNISYGNDAKFTHFKNMLADSRMKEINNKINWRRKSFKGENTFLHRLYKLKKYHSILTCTLSAQARIDTSKINNKFLYHLRSIIKSQSLLASKSLRDKNTKFLHKLQEDISKHLNKN